MCMSAGFLYLVWSGASKEWTIEREETRETEDEADVYV